IPPGEIATVNSFYQVALGMIGVFTLDPYGFFIVKVLYSLLGFEMKLHPELFVCSVHKTEGVTAKSMHVPVTVRRSAVCHNEHYLMQAFRIKAPEIPHHGRAFCVCTRVSLL